MSTMTLLNTRQAAKIAGRSESTIKWHCDKGHIPGAFKHGDNVKDVWLIPAEGLQTYMASKKYRAV